VTPSPSDVSSSFLEFAKWLDAEFRPKGFNVPTTRLPDIFFRLAGFFHRGAAAQMPLLGKRPCVDNTRLTSVLGVKPIDAKQSIIDMAQSMVERGIVKKKK